ncbi:MAG: hypothetical protein IKQ61_11170 [Spirochaetales bacterium]|nr:hypothetical protein [Spirochaetales bacterium]
MKRSASVIIGPRVIGMPKDISDKLSARYSVFILKSFKDADKLTLTAGDNLFISDADAFSGKKDPKSSQVEFRDALRHIEDIFPDITILCYASEQSAKLALSMQEAGLVHDIILKPYDVATLITKIEDTEHVLSTNRRLVNVQGELNNANRNFNRFFSVFSQKLRVPVNSLFGFAQLLGRSSLTIKQKEYLAKMQANLEEILSMTNALSDLTNVGMSEFQTENTDFNIHNLLHSAANIVGMNAYEKGVETVFQVRPGTSSYFNGPVSMIEQVLVGLLNTMITYSQNGRIIVYLEQSHNNLSENKQFLHIRIVSECMNIDDVHLTKLAGILQPHADNMLVADDYDEMVEVRLAKKNSRSIGGELSYSYIDERTSVIDFDFVCRYFTQTAMSSYNIPDNIRGMKVLIVDGNIVSRDALNMMLENMSFRVTNMASGAEAVEDIVENKDEPYKLVVLSQEYNDGSFVSVIKNIQTNFNIKDRPKILITSSYSYEQIYMKMDNMTVDGFLAKPIVPEVMFDTIVNLFREEEDFDTDMRESMQIQKTEAADNKIYLDELGELEGINQNFGLERVGGNVSLYRIILLKFYNSNRDTIQRVRANIASGNDDMVRSILKNTRELASNIGAFDLRKSLDDILFFVEADKMNYVDGMIPSAEAALNVVLRSISQLDKRGDFREKIISDNDHILINEMTNLEIMLREENYAVDDVIQRIREKLAGTRQLSVFESGVKLIKTGMTHKAIEVLNAIKKSIQDIM